MKDFLKKLDLDDVHIAKALSFRLGKGRSSGDRPVLVRFNSQGEKARVMKEKRKLRNRNSRVFINHDWTREQREQFKRLRTMRKQAIDDGHEAIIKNGQLLVDGQRVDTYSTCSDSIL